MFYLIFPNCVKVTNTANLIENEQKIKPLLWPSEVGNRKIRALNLRLSGQILNMQSWFCRCVWGLVSNHMFMHNWRSERSDMLCSLICIAVHQWKHNSSAAPHVCYRELISIWRAASLGWDAGAKIPLSLSLLGSFSYWYLCVFRTLPWLFCIRGTSNETKLWQKSTYQF